MTCNPNFAQVYCFKQIEVREDMLLWPLMIIQLFD